jgi:hypothetical protein
VISASATRRVSRCKTKVRQVHDQFREFTTEPRSSRAKAVPGAIELVSHELPEPSENSVRFGNRRHLFESLPSESFANDGQSGTLGIRQEKARRQMGAQDSMLGQQIFILQQKLLIHHSGHIRQ